MYKIASLNCIFALTLMMPVAGIASADEELNSNRATRRTPVVDVFESSRDAVVNISSREIITVRDPFGGMFEDLFDMPTPFRDRARQYTRTSVGSGFVIHPEGYIVTNAHVVAQTAERKAIFADGREFDAQVVAFDTTRDLAVLKIESDHPLPTLRLGRSNDLMIGETVIAIGNPVGLQHTVTAGVISATGRDLDIARHMSLRGLIQTDASINPGNSGGPLLNVLGELIGVNTAIRGDAQNIGFAIPVDQLREVLPGLLDIERRYRIICGLTVDTLGEPKITDVRAGTPAQRAGLQVGDVLLRLNQRPIKEGIDFFIAMIGCQAGQELDIEYLRDGKPCAAQLTLEGKPAPDGDRLALERLGVVVEPLTPETAESIGLTDATGLLITQVERGGPADRTGIRRRDVLAAIGRHPIASAADLGELLEYTRPGESIPITLLRVEGRMKYILKGEVQAR